MAKAKSKSVELEYPVEADQLAALGFDGFGPAESGSGTVGKIANACPLWIGGPDRPSKGKQSVKLSTGFRNSLSLSKAVQFADWLHDKATDETTVAVVRALSALDGGIHSPKSAAEIATELAAKNAHLERKLAEMEKALRSGQKADAAA
jgi:hypothetical protein